MLDRGGAEQTGRQAWVRGGTLRSEAGLPVTLGHVLSRAARQGGAGLVCAETEHCLSYADLLQEALCIAGSLKARGARAGDPVVLQLERTHDLVSTVWACFLGGYVAVPVAPVAAFATNGADARRLQAVCHMLSEPLIVAAPALGEELRAGGVGARLVTPETLRSGTPAEAEEQDPQAPALLLLTSGSTGRPKGVPLSHANVLAMVAGTAQMNGFGAADTTLNWMPLDHAGALIFLGVLPAWLGASQVHVPTRRIVERPLLWLELIARHRAAISWAPNFAFSLVNRAAEQLRQMAPDLSCLRFLVNAGEQVTAATAGRFLSVLAPFGVPEDVLRPAFGMSETCSGITWSTGLTSAHLARDSGEVSLGRPIPGAEMRVTGEGGTVLQEDESGRLELRGASVIAGYYASPEADAEAFTADGWFRTGDIGFIREGELYLTGREKEELVCSGRKVPLHDVEGSVETVPGVVAACTCAFATRGAETDALVVTFCPEQPGEEAWPSLVRRIRAHLACDMGLVPVHVVPLLPAEVPRSSIGKIGRRSLQAALARGDFALRIARFDTVARDDGQEPLSAVEHRVAAIWREALDLPQVGRDENFFDLGGHSLLLIKVQSMLEAAFGPVALASLFMHPTVSSQARFLAGGKPAEDVPPPAPRPRGAGTDVAVIGMACRFPGADSVDEFWRNLRDGVESVRGFTAEDAEREGVDPRSARHPAYVAASPVLNDAAGFDAEFFGFTDREAELMDPQHRQFLECCWEAVEDAGQDTLSAAANVGVYAGASMNTYLLNNVLPARAGLDPHDDLRSLTLDSMGGFQLMVASDKDYLATRVSYKLNLRGPSLTIQTACSTGLVVIHQAARSLVSGECDMAIAGTASVQAPQMAGHLYQDGMIVAPDGHCRAFDADARGTVFGSGVGAVVLKRLDDALADGDRVLAVVKGSAVNNDGLRKVGYMAPSEAGQGDVARAALAAAGVMPDSVGFVEAHGTGTAIGDPIEVSSLARAYHHPAAAPGSIALGSVKTNVGHLQISSGIAGFIKAVLALQHRQIPPTLHYQRPNPAIGFERTPFFVNPVLRDWVAGETPRRAGVNSLGIGGTNAHVILEEAPPLPGRTGEPASGWHLLPLSARSPEALAALLTRYHARALDEPSLDLADLCYSAAAGRHHFDHRFTAVFADRPGLLDALAAPLPSPLPKGGDIAFLFTGQGAQYAGMALELHRAEPVFRAALDRCADVLQAREGLDLLTALGGTALDGTTLDETANAQPALFAVGYALAMLWQARGVRPAALLGHSLGEYVAACVAGVFSLEDGLRLVTARGRLMQALPRDGAMLALMTDAARVEAAMAPYGDTVAIAALNGPGNTVISGRSADVDALAARFAAEGVQAVALRTSHAFHSPLMRPVLEPFRAVLATVALRPPVLPLVSNLTGAVEGALFADPSYWLRHVVEPVRFARGLDAVGGLGCTDLVEIGPKPVLAGLVRAANGGTVLASLRPGVPDGRQMLESLGELYRRGLTVTWSALHGSAARRRVSLPTYPFQHRRHWIEPRPHASQPPPPALHPLAHRRLRLPGLSQAVFETTLDPRRLPLLEQHRVYGEMVVAGASHLSMLLAGAALLTGREAQALRDVSFVEPMLLPERGIRQVQMQFLPAAFGYEVRLVGFEDAAAEGEHRLHVTAILADEPGALLPAIDPDALRARCPRIMEGVALRARLADRHIALGPQFGWLERLWVGEGEALFELRPPEGEAIDPAFQLHPGLLDSLLQPALAVLAMDEGNDTCVPVALEAFHFFGRPAAFPLHGHVRRRGAAQEVADIGVFDAAGACVAEVRGFEFRRLDAVRVGTAPDLDAALYGVCWEDCPAPVVAAADFPAPAVLVADGASLRETLGALLAVVDSPRHQRQADDLEALGLAYLAEALADALPAPGAWRSAADIALRLRLAPNRDRLLRRLLHVLERHGVLAGREGGWEALDCPPTLPAATQHARIEARYGAAAEAELTLLAACGTWLGAILRGEADPLEALFPGGDTAVAERLYQDSPGFAALNALLAELVGRLARSLPAGRRLRILEVGAGTGATSHHVLRQLEGVSVDYVFTDVSPLFLARARDKFAARPGMEYRLLDIERDPAEQGIEPGSVDLVIAANVLHATRDLAETVFHVRRMLRPGGHLVLLEVNEPTIPVDLTFGLLDGWWRFTDLSLRPSYPLLSRRQWRTLLEAQGFATAVDVPIEIPGPGGLQSVILAQADGAASQRPGTWAVLGEAEDAQALVDALVAAGARARPLDEPGLDAALAGGEPLRGVVLLAAPGGTVAGQCGAAIRLLQVQTHAGIACPVHLVTRGVAEDPAQAALQGLGRVLFAEHPEMVGGLIDRDNGDSDMRPLAGVLLEGRAEDELALRGGRVLAARLRPLPAPPMAAALLRADGTYLVTGGLGGIGLRLAAALAARGARHLLLLGRTAPSAAAQAALDAIVAEGVHVRVALADVADDVALAAVLAPAEGEPPLRGVFHLAGVLRQGVLTELAPEEFATATAAKIEGALNLHWLTRAAPLDHFVLFSSAAALLGLPGQGAYAAANAALDALARRRRAEGLPALSVGWGRWSDVGMVATEAARLEAAGHLAVRPDAGLALLARLSDGPACQAVLPVDWPRFLAGLPRRSTLLAELGRPASPPPVPIPPASHAVAPVRGGMSEYLAAELQRIAGSATRPTPASTLPELGLDSLMSIGLRNRIAREVGVNLPLGMLMDTKLEQLAAELETRLDLAERTRLKPEHLKPGPVPAEADDVVLEEDILL